MLNKLCMLFLLLISLQLERASQEPRTAKEKDFFPPPIALVQV